MRLTDLELMDEAKIRDLKEGTIRFLRALKAAISEALSLCVCVAFEDDDDGGRMT